jgi:hypothetical protein
VSNSDTRSKYALQVAISAHPDAKSRATHGGLKECGDVYRLVSERNKKFSL